MAKKIQTTFFILLFPLILLSANQNIKFERISAEQGLSKSCINCILQDSHGFMWFGSELGLKKYDGYKFIVYKHDPENPYSLNNDNIRAITEDKSGSIWIATLLGGLNRFNRVTERFIHYKIIGENLPKKKEIYTYAILEDQRGKLWIGTNIGLCYFDREINAVKRYSGNSSIPEKLINGRAHILYEDVKGKIWIGTKDDGLFRFDPASESFKHYSHDPQMENSLSSIRIESITEDKFGNLFIGTRNGLNKFDRQKNNFIRYLYQSFYNKIGEQNWIRAICPAYSNLLWIATSEGLFKFDHETGKIKDIPNDTDKKQNLENHTIKKLYKDLKGILWVGTYTGDIFKYDPYKTKFYQYISNSENPHGLTHNFIWGICEDSNGNLWVGTGGGGLYELRANQLDISSPKWIHYKNDPKNSRSISNNSVNCIIEDHEQTLWIGTYSGLNKIVQPKINHRSVKNQIKDISFRDNIPEQLQTLKNHIINCIYEDKAKTFG